MSTGMSALQYALKTLRAHWDEAKLSWQDQVSRDFEERHLGPMETQVEAAMRGMGKLAEVMVKVRRDCE